MRLALYDQDGRQVLGGDAYEILAGGLLGRDRLTVCDALDGCRLVIESADGAQRIAEVLKPKPDLLDAVY